MKHFITIAIAATMLLACNKTDESGKSATIQQSGISMGLWRAVATVPGGDLPFHFELSGTVDAPAAHLINGAERVAVRNVTLSRDSLVLELPAFNSRIALAEDNGVLSGILRLVKRGGVEQIMPVRATYAQGMTHTIAQEAGKDFSGRWEVTFTEDDGTTYPAVGEFEQDGTRITGTFLTTTGDYRFLEGEAQGDEFYLSCFDGAHAFLFKAQLEPDGALSGEFWSGTRWHESWRAGRNENAKLPDPASLTQLAPGYETISFAFPDADSNIVSFPSEQFQGKVTVVALLGTWCPNCHDETALFAEIYSKYHESGLEAVGLMYEHYRDFDRASQQVKLFRQKYDIEYPLLVAGYSDKKEAAATLPMLSAVKAFPTLIVVGRDGKVRRIYTGFSGPGTGPHYQEFSQEFTAVIEDLLAEKG